MTRFDLIQRLCHKFPDLGVKDVDKSVRTILDELARALCRGQRVEIRGFGSFCLHYRSPRQGRNPSSGAPVAVPAKYAPHFKPGKELRARVDK